MTLGPLAAAALFMCSMAAADGLPDLPQLPQVGSTLETLDRNRYICGEARFGYQCRRAGETHDRVEGESATEIVLVYRKGILVRSVISIDEQHFRSLADRISVTLGTALKGEEALNAGMGGTFNNGYFLWRRDGRSWLLEQFFERVISSGLWIMSDDEFDMMMSERERRRVRGVRNL